MYNEYFYACPQTLNFVFKVVRTDLNNGKKEFYQSHLKNGEWIPGKGIFEIAPYLFQEWKDKIDDPIYFVEGEKCSERLKKEGLCSSTTPGGSNSWKNSFAKFFKNRTVYILPDNDEPGKNYAESVAGDLNGVAKIVKIVNLPGLGLKEDICEYLEKNTLIQLQELVDNEKVYESILTSSNDEISYNKLIESYPLVYLPESITFCLEKLKNYSDGSPIGFATALFAMLSAFCGAGCRFQGNSLNNYYVLCGSSGYGRKTTILNFVKQLMFKIILKRPDLTHQIVLPPIQEQPEKYAAIQNITSFSVEGLEEASKGNGISIFATPGEYKSILALNQRSSQANTIPVLTSMYDGGEINTQLRGKKINVSNFTLTILAASTETWLKEILTSDSIASGFFNRHLFGYCPIADEPLIEKIEFKEEDWNEMVEKFLKIIPVRKFRLENNTPFFETEITYLEFENDEVKLLNDNFVKNMHKAAKQQSDETNDISARLIPHAHKLAGLHAVCNNKKTIDKTAFLFGMYWAEASLNFSKELIKTKDNKLPKLEKNLLNLIHRLYNNDFNPVKKFIISKKTGGNQNNNNLALQNLINKKLIKDTSDGYVPVSP